MPMAKRYKKAYYAKPQVLLGNSESVIHKYIEFGTLNAGAAGAPATVVFSANGMYDPNISGVGHQPRGFDQLGQLFDHYKVTNALIKVTFLQGNSSFTENAIVGVLLIDDATPPADCITELEQRNVVYTGLGATGSATKQVSLNFNSKSFFSKMRSGDSLIGTTSANPSDQGYFVVFVQSPNASDLPHVNYCVEIVYTATWMEPNNLASS